MLQYIQANTFLYRLVQVYRILREISISRHKTSMNLYILVHTSSTYVLWTILLESYTPGCTIACFSALVHHGIYSLVAWHGALYFPRPVESMYLYVPVRMSIYKYKLNSDTALLVRRCRMLGTQHSAVQRTTHFTQRIRFDTCCWRDLSVSSLCQDSVVLWPMLCMAYMRSECKQSAQQPRMVPKLFGDKSDKASSGCGR